MGFELDRLKNNEIVSVLYNNTNGFVREFYSIMSLLKIFEDIKIEMIDKISYEELQEFYIDYEISIEDGFLIAKLYNKDIEIIKNDFWIEEE